MNNDNKQTEIDLGESEIYLNVFEQFSKENLDHIWDLSERDWDLSEWVWSLSEPDWDLSERDWDLSKRV